MPIHPSNVEPSGIPIVLRVSGKFDGAAAASLRQTVLDVGGPVTIDFSGVDSFADLAVAVLMRGLDAPNLQVRGLTPHPERMFRYFGLRMPADHPRPYYKAEELICA